MLGDRKAHLLYQIEATTKVVLAALTGSTGEHIVSKAMTPSGRMSNKLVYSLSTLLPIVLVLEGYD